MALGITADGTAFTDAIVDLHAAADRLRDDRDRAARSVSGLLSGWSGAAADSYEAGWTAWCDGADRVADALATMAGLLGSVSTDLDRVDDGAGSDLARLAGRLGQ